MWQLGFVGWVMLAQVESAEPRREIELPKFVVRLVDATTHQPAAQVELWWMLRAQRDQELQRRWGSLQDGFDPVEYDQMVRSLGLHATSGADGSVELLRPKGVLRLVASDATRWGALEVAEGELGPLTFELAPQTCIDVHVVDGAGKSVAGVPVAIGWRHGDEPATNDGVVPTDIAWPAGFEGVVTTNTEGVARFRRTNQWSEHGEPNGYVALLGFPIAARKELAIEPASANAKYELVLPPIGRVVLKFPGVACGVAQLRRRAWDDTYRIWRDHEPARAAIIDGRAEFPFVGVGTSLQYRATWAGLAPPVAGVLAGPRREGELVEFETEGAFSVPRICGRLVDEEGRVIANEEIYFTIELSRPGSGSSDGRAITTTEEGRFEFNVGGMLPNEARTLLTIAVPRDRAVNRSEGGAAMSDLSGQLGLGRHELGDIVLYRPGSLPHVRSLSDDALEHLYVAATDGCGFSGDPAHDADSCLTVMAERGGPRWIEFLESEVAPLLGKSLGNRPRERRFDSNIPLLTALRRAERMDDPCVLELEGDPLLEAQFGDSTVVRYVLKNVDKGSESLWVVPTQACGSPIDCRVDAVDAAGRCVERNNFSLDRFIVPTRIEPGASCVCGIDLQRAFGVIAPGDYRMRIHHRSGGNHRSFFAATDSPLAGWIAMSSSEFMLRVLPRPIRLPKSERRRLRERFDSLPIEEPPFLIAEAIPADATWSDTVAIPGEEFARAGWSGVPSLLDVLDEPGANAKRRAWALALLASITPLRVDGCDDQVGGMDDSEGALGRHRYCYRWPGLIAKDGVPPTVSEVGGPTEPDAALQERAIARWRSIRESLSVSE